MRRPSDRDQRPQAPDHRLRDIQDHLTHEREDLHGQRDPAAHRRTDDADRPAARGAARVVRVIGPALTAWERTCAAGGKADRSVPPCNAGPRVLSGVVSARRYQFTERASIADRLTAGWAFSGQCPADGHNFPTGEVVAPLHVGTPSRRATPGAGHSAAVKGPSCARTQRGTAPWARPAWTGSRRAP